MQEDPAALRGPGAVPAPVLNSVPGKASVTVCCGGAPEFTAEPRYPIALNTCRNGKHTIYKDSTGKIKIMLAQYLFLRQNTIEEVWNLTRGERFIFAACGDISKQEHTANHGGAKQEKQ